MRYRLYCFNGLSIGERTGKPASIGPKQSSEVPDHAAATARTLPLRSQSRYSCGFLNYGHVNVSKHSQAGGFRAIRRARNRGRGSCGLAWLALLAHLATGSGPARAGELLVPLAQPGPWSGVSGLVGYGARLWFVNSVKFVNHNSADVYSYDPASGETRYERHLFSQDAGAPVVAGGLLYWPFEDARFSARRGEYMLTNGRAWRWGVLPEGRVFHVHAMAAHRGALYAATSAWRAGLQRSDDGGATWEVVYDHPTEPGRVSRITVLAILGDTLYAGLTAWHQDGIKLLRWVGDTLRPAAGWPEGTAVTALAAYRGWLYGVSTGSTGRAVWRTDGAAVERVAGLDGRNVRDLAAGPDALWAVDANGSGGALWRSVDGLSWTVAQRFRDAEPLDVAIYGGGVYAGTAGPDGRGTLWGPPPPAPVEPSLSLRPLPPEPPPAAPEKVAAAVAALDRLLADAATFEGRLSVLLGALRALALSGAEAAGAALTQRLDAPVPDVEVARFGGKLKSSAKEMARWYHLWALALNGHGRVPPALLSAPFDQPTNPAEKYFEPAPAAAWAAAQLMQADNDTVAALVARLDAEGDPPWLAGDIIGALAALTGERFGYDIRAWRAWWGAANPTSTGSGAPGGGSPGAVGCL